MISVLILDSQKILCIAENPQQSRNPRSCQAWGRRAYLAGKCVTCVDSSYPTVLEQNCTMGTEDILDLGLSLWMDGGIAPASIYTTLHWNSVQCCAMFYSVLQCCRGLCSVVKSQLQCCNALMH